MALPPLIFMPGVIVALPFLSIKYPSLSSLPVKIFSKYSLSLFIKNFRDASSIKLPYSWLFANSSKVIPS
jgi:hypothetical protein